MTSWVKELFGKDKPVIAMAHIPALPGTPRYDRMGGISYLLDHVGPDVENLCKGGADAILFCNEDDRPYVLNAGIEQIAAMTRVVNDFAPRDRLFGIDFLWDGMAAMAMAHATGATFIREVLTGTYESDMGLWSPNAGEVLRFREQIGASGIRVFMNIVPEFASSLGTRTVAQRARSAIVSSLADVILISGPMAGEEPDVQFFEQVKAVTADVPVFVNTGAKPGNIAQYLMLADGVIVGSSLKVDGHTWNQVDPARVDAFMEQVEIARSHSSKGGM